LRTQHGADERPYPVGTSVRAQEDSDGSGSLQAWQWPHQGQRTPPRPDRARDASIQDSGAGASARQGEIRWCGHSRASQGRRSRCSNLRHQTSHLQGSGGILPKVRGRGVEEGDQGHPRLVRPHAPRRGPSSLRAQEVRRSRGSRALPEVLPLIDEPSTGAPRGGSWNWVGRRVPRHKLKKRRATITIPRRVWQF